MSAKPIRRPSASSNAWRCEKSQRPNARLIAPANRSNVKDGETANTRPGGGSKLPPNPPTSSTLICNHDCATTIAAYGGSETASKGAGGAGGARGGGSAGGGAGRRCGVLRGVDPCGHHAFGAG